MLPSSLCTNRQQDRKWLLPIITPFFLPISLPSSRIPSFAHFPLPSDSLSLSLVRTTLTKEIRKAKKSHFWLKNNIIHRVLSKATMAGCMCQEWWGMIFKGCAPGDQPTYRPSRHFLSCCPYRKTVRVKIVDEEEYERQENFFIVLGEPKWMERGISGVRFLKKKKKKEQNRKKFKQAVKQQEQKQLYFFSPPPFPVSVSSLPS